MSGTVLTVSLPILPDDHHGGLQKEVASTRGAEGTKIVLSTGIGWGNAEMYVSIGGKRVLTVDAMPLLVALINVAKKKTGR